MYSKRDPFCVTLQHNDRAFKSRQWATWDQLPDYTEDPYLYANRECFAPQDASGIPANWSVGSRVLLHYDIITTKPFR